MKSCLTTLRDPKKVFEPHIEPKVAIRGPISKKNKN